VPAHTRARRCGLLRAPGVVVCGSAGSHARQALWSAAVRVKLSIQILGACVLFVIIWLQENTGFLLFGRLDKLSVGLLSFSAAVALINIYIYLWFFCL